MFCGKSSKLHAIAKARGDTFRLYDSGPERHEISDEQVFLKFDPLRPKDTERLKQGTTLGKLIEHPALFEAYPELRALPIRAAKSPNPRTNAAFSPLHGIFINEQLLKNEDGLRLVTLGILHETQHAIQTIEGDHNGSSPKAVESLVMREVMRPQLDTVAKMLTSSPDIHASEIEFPAVRAFVALISNPRLALKDPQVMEKMHSIGFNDSELIELGQTCEAIFKMRNLAFASENFDSARKNHKNLVVAAYQALPGELEAHLTPRRLMDPKQAQIPKVLIAPENAPLKDRLIIAIAKVAFRMKMSIARIKSDMGDGFKQEHATKPAFRRPVVQEIGGDGDERVLESRWRLSAVKANDDGQRIANKEILSAITQARSMTSQEKIDLIKRANESVESQGFNPNKPPHQQRENIQQARAAAGGPMSI